MSMPSIQSVIHPSSSSLRAASAPMRDYMARNRARLIQALDERTHGGTALARTYSDIADSLVRNLFVTAARDHDSPLLLGAVGGYGRRLLGLNSDLDLCFVTTERPEVVGAVLDAILYPLWDAGIRVGHQIVRTSEVVQEAKADLAMATELLDFRPIAGDISLMHSLGERLSDGLFSEAEIVTFISQLEAHARERHAQFGDSVYLLEPDVKSGTGGLRDLDFALWAARARFGTSDLGRLVELDVLTSQHKVDVERALDFLWTVRHHLHRTALRKADRLTFVEQENVAKAMGYEGSADSDLPSLQRTGEMVERFMSDYYRHARVIAHVRDRVIGRAKRRPSRFLPVVVAIAPGLVECEGGVALAEPDLLDADPTLALRVFAEAVSRDKPLLARTRDAIACATLDARFCERLRESREAADLFVALVSTRRAVAFSSGSVLTALHDVGLLLAMIPEFAPVVGRVHHDLYHVYTVDVHSIAAVDRLRALARGDLAQQLPLASRLAAEVTRPRVLFLATLLHDVGKSIGGRNHAQRGADMGRIILKRLGLSEEEIDDACHLILHHLTMYMVAVRRDLGDPGTLLEFLRDVRGREGLRELYLLTVADVSTTSSVAMTKWKRGMLDGLFRASDAMMAEPGGATSDRVTRVRSEAEKLWEEEATKGEFKQFLESMPSRYFLSHAPEEILAHAELALRRHDGAVALSFVPSSHDGVLGLCVVTEGQAEGDLCVIAGDRPGLLAAISAAISANGFEIQAAQINSRSLSTGGYQAVDLFWVRSVGGKQPLEKRLPKLERDLTAVVGGEILAQDLVKAKRTSRWSSRPTPPVFTEVVFDHHASEFYTVIEVLAEDRPVLLFTLATVLHDLGINIGVAKISTEGKRAVDVFYATDLDGGKICPGQRTEEIRTALMEAVRATL